MDNKQVFQKHQKKVKFQVDSKYSILEIIGEGAYGVVCSAVDTTNGQRVAIKKICGVFDIPSITKRTLREIKILKHFKHDNVISIKEILRPPSNVNEFSDVYVVMDLMGSDLHHIIHSKQDLSQEHIRYFLYQLLRGLKYIHSANIIHRDLKPSNLLINKDCELKIGDFGMARSLSASLSEKKRVMTEYVATRWYRAPELMLSVHQFTKAIDVWSVGCIFAEMLGREALFPGSNYLNQLQLILSVVGVPSVEFMATITSERVRSYIGRLPHKNPVSFATLYPNASSEAIELLSQLLILDPGKRVCVENALKIPFLEKYHDLDDEPTCRKFDYDIEAIPLERDKLREHILQEIQYYHSKRAKPNLAPIQTDLLKSYKLPTITSTATPVVRFSDVPQNVAVTANQEQKTESKKRKQKSQVPCQASKKKPPQQQPEQQPKPVKNELSTQDKELLQRWANMQKETKPFIHPIRKHMDELLQIKAESVVPIGETVKGQAIVDRVSTTSKMTTPLQFTNFVPQQKNGGVALVAEQTVKMPPSTVIISSVVTSTVNTLNVSTVKSSTASRHPTVLPAKKAPQTILVPVGSVPMFQLQCAFGGTAPIVIIPNLATPKVSAPVHIAPKPVQVTNVPFQMRGSSNTIIAPSTTKHILPSSCVTITTRASTRTVVDLTKSECEGSNSTSDKNKINPTGSKILIRIEKPPSIPVSVVNNEIITCTDGGSTISTSIPSSSIHFNVSSQGEKENSSNSILSITTDDDSSSNSKKSEVLSGDLLSSRLLHSAGSFLSELTISSAELDSAQSSAKGIPVPQVSPEECAHVIAQVKRLDEEDKKIVSMIEELEESSEHSGSTTYDVDIKSNSGSSLSNTNSNTKNTVPIDIQPCTTVPSSHTDNWSIVKNMLVNSIRAKQLKKAQQEEQKFSTGTDTFAHASISGVTFTSISSVTSTSSTPSSSMQRSPVQYVTNTPQKTHEEYPMSVTSNNRLQTKQNIYSTIHFTPNDSLPTNQDYYSMNITSGNTTRVTQGRYSPIQTSNNSSQVSPNHYSINTTCNKYSTNVTSSNSIQVSQDRYPMNISSKNPSPLNQDQYTQNISKNTSQTGSQYTTVSSLPFDSNSSSSLTSVIQENPIQYMSHSLQSNQHQYSTNITSNVSIPRVSEYDSHNALTHSLMQDNSVTDIIGSSSISQNPYSTSITSNDPVNNMSNYNPTSITTVPLDSICISTPVSTYVSTSMQKNHNEYIPHPSKTLQSQYTRVTPERSAYNVSEYNLSTSSSQPIDLRTYHKTMFVSSQFPLLVDSIVTSKSSPSLKMEDKKYGNIPLIKVEDVPTEKITDVKEECTPANNLTIKIENSNLEKKECLKLETISLENSCTDIERKELKEEGNETLLSRCTFGGNLTPLLKCSISDVDDAFLTTFVNTPKTPKSGAAGYGLGMDFEDLFAGSSIDLLNPRYSVSQSESAPPLSASLLNDWLGMNDIDPADFDDLQRELESTSYSLLDSA